MVKNAGFTSRWGQLRPIFSLMCYASIIVAAGTPQIAAGVGNDV